MRFDLQLFFFYFYFFLFKFSCSFFVFFLLLAFSDATPNPLDTHRLYPHTIANETAHQPHSKKATHNLVIRPLYPTLTAPNVVPFPFHYQTTHRPVKPTRFSFIYFSSIQIHSVASLSLLLSLGPDTHIPTTPPRTDISPLLSPPIQSNFGCIVKTSIPLHSYQNLELRLLSLQ